MTLESGAAQLSFWALSDLEKVVGEIGNKDNDPLSPRGPGGPTPGATIYIQPMALKYTYPYDISSSLRETLKTLESKLGIKSNLEDGFNPRLLALGDKLLCALEREYEVKPEEGATTNERLKFLRGHILDTIAHKLGVELTPGSKELECVRVLRNKIDDFVYQEDKSLSAYERQVHEEKEHVYRGYYKDLNRVVNFIAIYAGYVTEHMTQERYGDVIERMEVEILGGAPTIKGPRQVLIDVGEAIDLSQYYQDYKTRKKETIAKVTEEVAAQISAMLLKLDSTREKIYLT